MAIAQLSEMSTGILGLSAYYHDSSAALVVDGEIVAAAAEERFTRLKHDSNFPRFAIRFCLEQGNLQPQQLDAIVFYEQPHVKFTRVVASTLASFPSSRRPFVSAMRDWLTEKLWIQNQISVELDVHPAKVRFVPHHHSHMAQAFLGSPYDEAAILTMDAVGEWTCTALGRGSRSRANPVELLEGVPYPHSLGLAYAAFTAFLGFRTNDGEANTMALASFGEPRFVDDVRRVIRVTPDGRYELNHSFFDFLSTDGNLFRPAFIQLFGSPRDWRDPLPFDALDDHFDGRVSDDDRRYADLAASVQRVIEEAVLGLTRRAQHLTKADRLCIAGGVALNAVANSRVIRDGAFADVFIPPDPGDGGGAVGAAMLGYYQSTRGGRVGALHPWLGRSGDASVVEGIVRHADPADWNAYTANPGRTDDAREELDSQRFANFEDLLGCVVEDLMAGRIVGWIQGRFELGPRALGNRSILADPGNLASVKRLSERVKRRARFRPYALSLCDEDFGRVFSDNADRSRSDGNGCIPSYARWMQTVRRVRDEVEPLVRGAIHHDRTTRLQVCSAQDNPRFHALLTAFGKRRGLGALLNTSFNEPGYPIVATPAEGLLMFARTDMDVLVMNDLVVRRRRYGENIG